MPCMLVLKRLYLFLDYPVKPWKSVDCLLKCRRSYNSVAGHLTQGLLTDKIPCDKTLRYNIYLLSLFLSFFLSLSLSLSLSQFVLD